MLCGSCSRKLARSRQSGVVWSLTRVSLTTGLIWFRLRLLSQGKRAGVR